MSDSDVFLGHLGQVDRAYTDWRGRSHFAGLDGLRFFAIFGVLFVHSPLSPLWSDYSRFFSRGFLGVDFFFVISGFLITTLLLREKDRTGKISLRGFYWRRALRILPLYLLVITAAGGYYAFVKHDPTATAAWPFYYVFLSNFLTQDVPTLYPTWSLSVEEQYYLLWPLLLVALPRPALPWVILGYIAFYLVAVWTGFAHVSLLTAGPFDLKLLKMPYGAILMGAGLALMLHHRAGFETLWRVIGRRWSAVFWTGLLLVEFAILPEIVEGLSQTVIHLTMTALIGSVVIREDIPVMPLLRFPPIMRIGMVSYGIYLLHLQAEHVAHALTDRFVGPIDDHLAIFIPLFWGLSWIFAEISFRFYEKRFLALRHKPLGFVPRTAKATASEGKSTP